MTYSKRLEQETPTHFWVNNPTPSEAKAALEIGNVVGVATNGNYMLRMLSMPETREDTIAAIDGFIKDGIDDDHLIVSLAARRAVGKCAEIFKPMFEQSGGKWGWAAIQGNPNRDEDYDYIVAEARRFYKQAPNMRVKFPATVQALSALEKMTGEGKATLATCGFSVQYGIDAMQAYERGVKKAGMQVPTLYVTALAGHVDEYLEKHIKACNIDIDPKLIENAGCEFAKELYKVQQERFSDANCRVLGGCRSYYHFTEMVPGDMSVTVNYDFIEMLNERDPKIEDRVGVRIGKDVRDEMESKLPMLQFTLSENNRNYAHWSMVPTALYFRNYVRSGWNNAAAMVRERRVMFK